MPAKKLTRRDFLYLSAGVSVGTILAACGPQPAASPEQPAPTRAAAEATPTPAVAQATATTEVAVETPAPAKEVTLRYIHWWCEGDAHFETLNWQVEEFEKRNPGIKIDSVCIPSDAPAKISSECAAGKCPEIINWATAQQAEEGLLLDITDWMNAHKDRFIWKPDVIQLKVNDKMYGWSAEFGTEAPVWNTRLLKKAGVSEIPMTWDDVLVVAEKLKSTDVAWSNMCWTPGYFNNLIPQIPGAHEIWVKAGETGQWDTPELREVGAQICQKILTVLTYTPGTDAEDDWDAAVKNFISERTAMEVNGTWTIGNDLKAQGAAEGLADVCSVKPFPKAFQGGTSTPVATYTMVGASAAVADNVAVREALFKFFDWWISEEVAKRYISEAQSPMGVTEPITPDLAGRLLSEFYAAISDADVYLTTPASMTKVGDSWNAPLDAIKALHAGKSINEAVDIWIKEMTPHA
jgi:ABC-type glycerol-3-phosphate transport system substrate-binding protein